MKNIIDFLTDLKANNDRLWFADNKDRYNVAKAEFEKIMGQLIFEVRKFDPTIGDVEPKDCVYRIYRDTRFSTDKTPYKTHLGGFIARGGGRKSPYGGYYMHIEPGASVVAGGIYMPEPAVLKSIRKEVYYNFERFDNIVTDSKFVAEFGEMDDERLKRVPKGFEPDCAAAEYLKYKHFCITKRIQNTELTTPNFIDDTTKSFKIMKPFNDFLNEAVESV